MTERERAWAAALSLAQGMRQIAASVALNAELAVMRRMLSAQLPGGEDAYWRLVHDELTADPTKNPT